MSTAVMEAKEKINSFIKKRKPKRWIMCAIAAVLIISLLATCMFSGKKPMQDAAQYVQETVARRTIKSALTGSGSLMPANSYTVTTLMEGEILSADFEEGDIVEKDTVLYQIDSSDASNNIEKSQLALNQAQRNYKNTVDKSCIKAPISGMVYELNVDIGDEVVQGTQIGTMRVSDTMTIELPFPADDAVGFYVGQNAEIMLDGSFETLYGKVTSISGSDIIGNGNMVSRKVKISVKNPGALGDLQVASAKINGVGCSSPGKFEYQAQSNLIAEASGTVSAIHIKEGQYANKNQVILTLGGDKIDDSIQNASENLKNAQLSMENTQNQLDNYTITSPIKGTIVDKQYKAGDTIEGGKILCTIYDLSYLEMTMNIDELDISKVSVGQEVVITAEAIEGVTYNGVITKVSVVSNTSTVQGGATSYPATVRIDQTEGLRPGMNVDAEIILNKEENVLAVPNEAVVRGEMILITDDSPSAKNATDREAPDGYVYVQVKTGVSDDTHTQIISGLTDQDTIAYIKIEKRMNNMPMQGMPMSGGGMPGGGMSGRPGGGGVSRGGPMG